jgi:hypothetical protein
LAFEEPVELAGDVADQAASDFAVGLALGHERSRRGELDGGSRIGARYRHTTPEMAARVVTAVEERLVVILATAEAALDQQPW